MIHNHVHVVMFSLWRLGLGPLSLTREQFEVFTRSITARSAECLNIPISDRDYCWLIRGSWSHVSAAETLLLSDPVLSWTTMKSLPITPCLLPLPPSSVTPPQDHQPPGWSILGPQSSNKLPPYRFNGEAAALSLPALIALASFLLLWFWRGFLCSFRGPAQLCYWR